MDLPEQVQASVAMVSAGGRPYVHTRSPLCKVCNSADEVRRRIEEETLSGRSWKQIMAALPDGCWLSARNIKDHFDKGHFPLHEPTVIAYLEGQALERHRALRVAFRRVADHLAIAERTVARLVAAAEWNRAGTESLASFFETARTLIDAASALEFAENLHRTAVIERLQAGTPTRPRRSVRG